MVHSIGIVDKLTALTQMAKSNKPTSDRQISHWVNATYTRGIFIADSLGCEKHNDVIRCYMLHNNASIEKRVSAFAQEFSALHVSTFFSIAPIWGSTERAV